MIFISLTIYYLVNQNTKKSLGHSYSFFVPLVQGQQQVPPQQALSCASSVLVQDSQVLFCARRHQSGSYNYAVSYASKVTFLLYQEELVKTSFIFQLASAFDFQLSNAFNVHLVDCKVVFISAAAPQCSLSEISLNLTVQSSKVEFNVFNSAHLSLQRVTSINNSEVFFQIQTNVQSSFGLVKNVDQGLSVKNSELSLLVQHHTGAAGSLASEFTSGVVNIQNSVISGSFSSDQANWALIGIAHNVLEISFSGFAYCVDGNVNQICGAGDCSFLISEDFPGCKCPEYLRPYPKCQCPAGFRDTGASCLECASGSSLNGNNQCVCGGGQQFDGTACVSCPLYKNIFGGVCSCPYNHQDNKVACLTCFGYPLVNGKCMCDTDVMYTGTQCIACPNYKYPLDEQCLCQPGESDNGLNCVVCPADSNANPAQASCSCHDPLKDYVPLSNKCECKVNYRVEIASCVLCPADSTTTGLRDQAACTCNDVLKDYVAASNNCQCQVNSIVSAATCKVCPANGNTNSLRDQTACLCNDSQMAYSPADNLCKCNADTYISLQTCLPCPAASSTNGQVAQASCTCTDPLKVHDQVKLECNCKVNHYQVVDACYPCQASATTNGLSGQPTCTCPEPSHKYQIASNTCKCPLNTFISGAVCVDCPQNSSTLGVLDAAACTCLFASQTFYPNATCLCPANNYLLPDKTCSAYVTFSLTMCTTATAETTVSTVNTVNVFTNADTARKTNMKIVFAPAFSAGATFAMFSQQTQFVNFYITSSSYNVFDGSLISASLGVKYSCITIELSFIVRTGSANGFSIIQFQFLNPGTIDDINITFNVSPLNTLPIYAISSISGLGSATINRVKISGTVITSWYSFLRGTSKDVSITQMSVQFTSLQIGNKSSLVVFRIQYLFTLTVTKLNLSGPVHITGVSSSLPFLFGSIAGCVQDGFTVIISQVQSDLQYQVDTEWISVGLIANSTDDNVLTISQCTIADTSTFQATSNVQMCGFCNISGTISVTAISYKQSYSGAYSASYAGLVGQTYATCTNLIIQNTIVSINMSDTALISSGQSYVGAVIGIGLGTVNTLTYVLVDYFKVAGNSFVGAFCGHCTKLTVLNSNVTNGTVIVNAQSGGVIGVVVAGANISLTTVFVTNFTCSATSNVGLIGLAQSANISLVSVNMSNISFTVSGNQGAGFIGYSTTTNITILTSILTNFTVSCTSYAANFVAYATGSSGLKLNIQNSVVTNSTVTAGTNANALWSNPDGLMTKIVSGSQIVNGTVNGVVADGVIS
ncbi:Conserved_hypothetical protein [Hexamita inflata]|uniref:Uncharacterized protein n=1 Tax=Hexamita inflata TaxID=28002 RepID=A0AA86R7B4_9EUKA|nr:Conserved hypothetical protein [Hexamita inflata]